MKDLRKDMKNFQNVTKVIENRAGITLIALVITIIIMLILAGVSINVVVGQNGILGRARNSVTVYKEAKAKEEVQMAWTSAETEYYNNMNSYIGVSKEDYITKDVLDRCISDTGKILELSKNSVGHTIKYKSYDSSEEYTFILYDNGYIETSKFLVDKVAVGEYIDIGIDYNNELGDSAGKSNFTGWRVIDRIGSGPDGYVKLISAGSPLSFYHGNGNNGEYSISLLNDMYKELEHSSSSSCYFLATGFDSWDMTNIFTEAKYINTAKGIHAIGCGSGDNSTIGEIENLYQKVTGIETPKTIQELRSIPNVMLNTNLQTIANSNWKEIYSDLLSIGSTYWIGGTQNSNRYLYIIASDSRIAASQGRAYGIRPVISLQNGVKISDNNLGDGSTVSSAWEISK